jgi:hypothetical protein
MPANISRDARMLDMGRAAERCLSGCWATSPLSDAGIAGKHPVRPIELAVHPGNRGSTSANVIDLVKISWGTNKWRMRN